MHLDKEKLDSIYIPHLRSQLSQGRAVLFTGAGFSLAAKNSAGKSLPTVAELRKMYWHICYPNDPFDESASLQDLFDEARVRHRPELVQTTVRALTVDAKTIPEWYASVFSMPWLAAYTLNIDDLADAAGRRFGLPRNIKSRSALDPAQLGSHPRRSSKLEVLHLNGALSGLPDLVTFSTTQYAQRIADRDPAYMRVVGDLLTRTVVFIGSSLDESPLWQHIELRGSRGDRGMGELRPRSYLVTPQLSKPRESLLARHNVVWLPMTAEQFVEQVLGRMTDVVADGLKRLKVIADDTQQQSSLPIEVGQLRPDPNEKTEFLVGSEPTWSDLVSGRAVQRDIDEHVWRTAHAAMSSAGQRTPIAIIGTAGSGKSTTLLRAALRIANEGHKVLWIDRNLEIAPGSIVDLVSKPGAPSAIAIDDADRYGPHLSTLLRDCVAADARPLMLIEMRSQHVDRCINRIQLKSAAPTEIVMPPLSDSDVDALLAALDKENRLGRLKGMTLAQQRAVFRGSADRDLLVAMYEATTGLKLKQRVLDELTELAHPANLIYAIAAVAASKRFDLSRDELLLAVGDSSNETLNELDRLARRGMLVAPRSAPERLGCRHRRVGELLLEGVASQGFMQRVVVGILTAGAAKAHADLARSARPFRIIRTFLNHEFLHDVLDVQQSRDVYGDCESLLHWDYHFWLHRGAFEVEWGDLGLAENFLAQAKALMPNDPFVKNEWAYLLFKKAVRNAGSVDAKKWATEARDILIELTYDDIPRAHPYHVLVHQGLAWAAKAISHDQERIDYLNDLRRHIARGLKQFPQSMHLRNASEQLEEAYLREAVRRT